MTRTILTGALIALALSIALTAVFYAGEQVAGLPFPPFDVFDWTARIEQLGGLITFGIEAMIAVITALGGDLSAASKPAEQLMAMGGLVGTGAVVGGALFGVLRARGSGSGARAGLVAGAVIGAPVTLISHSLNQPPLDGLVVNTLWILGAYLAWGYVLGVAYARVGRPIEAAPAPVETASAEGGRPPASVTAIDRRNFLIRLGGATAVVTVAGAGLGAVAADTRARQRLEQLTTSGASARTDLPNAGDAVMPAPGTRPEYTPVEEHYRIDINSRWRDLDTDSWRLNVTGMVDRPASLTLDDLRAYPALDQYVTLSCISNPVAGNLIGTTRWTGVSLQQVLADLGVQEGARHLVIRSADGFHESVALDLINSDERIMLTYAWDGNPLPPEHGFPLRIYIPDRYGMKQPKWITDIDVTDVEVEGFWVARGWDPVARMKATSVIDTVAVESVVEVGGQSLIPIGGIAHAGARGISKVEVQVDDGDWVEAALRAPLSETTWVIWRYDWPFTPGRHSFTVRCFEGDGAAQIVDQRGAHPSGATGLHTVRESV